MKIAVGTLNKAKIAAVEAAIQQLYDDVEFVYVDVSSGVSEQPFSTEETRTGAINRAKAALATVDADWAFGLEGGVEQLDDTLYCCNWGALVLSTGETFACAGAQFALPKEIAAQLIAGEELGPVMDRYTKTQDIRQHAGAIGILTNGLIDRKEMFVHVVTLLVGQAQFFTSLDK